MNFPFYIAKRYLLAKKSHNLINIISGISVAGIGVGAFALIVVLSVFNGFGKVIESLIDTTTPDLLIEARKGRYIPVDRFPSTAIAGFDEVRVVVEVLEEDALFRYQDKQHIGRIKAVSTSFSDTYVLDSLIIEGSPQLGQEGRQAAVAGVGVAWYLGLRADGRSGLLQIYVPGRGNASAFQPDQGFNMDAIHLGGIFSSQQEFDGQIVFVPIDFARKLLGLYGQASSFELYLREGAHVSKVKKQLNSVLGEDYLVKDSHEQQETLFNIMKSEKWAIFIILTFILFMATFNVIGSLTMLIVDKQKDTAILRQLGASAELIRKLFLAEGLLISTAGGIIGLLTGILVVWLQEAFGLIRLGDGSGNFVIDAYPVDLQWHDILLVLVTVLIIGGLSSFVTVRRLVKKVL